MALSSGTGLSMELRGQVLRLTPRCFREQAMESVEEFGPLAFIVTFGGFLIAAGAALRALWAGKFLLGSGFRRHGARSG